MEEAHVYLAVVLFGSNSPPHPRPPSYQIALLTSVGDPELDPDPSHKGVERTELMLAKIIPCMAAERPYCSGPDIF
jgi:hypothetical protein